MYKNKNKNKNKNTPRARARAHQATQPQATQPTRTVYYDELDELQLERLSAARRPKYSNALDELHILRDTPHIRQQYYQWQTWLWSNNWEYRSYLNNLDFWWRFQQPQPTIAPQNNFPNKEGLQHLQRRQWDDNENFPD